MFLIRFCILFSDIEISFTQGVYEFAEPESDTFYKIKIVKNRETEQTIYVGVLVSEPFSSLTPAQLYSPETADSADYRVSSSGNTFTLIFFLSHDESTNFSFRLLADTREESVEGFQATILPVEQFPPGGLTPTNGYNVYIPGEFSSAEVRIVDSTGRFVNTEFAYRIYLSLHVHVNVLSFQDGNWKAYIVHILHFGTHLLSKYVSLSS